MDFDLTDEQRLLKDSVDRLIADRYGFEQRKKYMAEADRLEPGTMVAIRGIKVCSACRSRKSMAASAAARSRP